jgi:hypothetical protein
MAEALVTYTQADLSNVEKAIFDLATNRRPVKFVIDGDVVQNSALEMPQLRGLRNEIAAEVFANDPEADTINAFKTSEVRAVIYPPGTILDQTGASLPSAELSASSLYEGDSTADRMGDWAMSSAGPNAAAFRNLTALRKRSHDFERNNPTVKGGTVHNLHDSYAREPCLNNQL